MHTTGGSNLFEGHNSFPDTVNMQDLTYANQSVNWQSQKVVYSISVTADSHRFALCNTSLEVTSSYYSTMVHAVTANDTTIHYLGY
jgi:hypothetical protein